MIVRDATGDDVRFVCAAMRDHNAREIFCTRQHTDRLGIAAEILERDPWHISVKVFCADDGTPAAILGAWIIGERQAGVQMVMTDAWPRIALPVIRYIRRTYIPFVLVPNVDRAETFVLVDTRYPLEWLRLLGFRVDDVRRVGGRKGDEVFARVVWTNPSVTVDGAGPDVASASSN